MEAAHAQTLLRWRADPVAFVRELFKVDLDEWQVDALRALTQYDRVAFIASKGVGKSFLEAMTGWWWMVTRKDAEVICTSTTRDNLRDGLWKEIAKWYGRTSLLQAVFSLNSDRVTAKENPNNWYMAARSWSKDADASQQANTLAGIHGDHMLYLGDEAGDYPLGVIAAANAMLANADKSLGREGKLLLGGNPVDPNGPLYRISTDWRNLWHVVNVNADPDNPKRSPRVPIQWAKDEIAQWGRDNPYVLVNVFGQFPPTGFNNLLGPDDVNAAQLRKHIEQDYTFAQKRIGVDVARFGDDATVLCIRQGRMTWPLIVRRGLDTLQVAQAVAMAMKEHRVEIAMVDGIGVGAGVVDALSTIHNVTVIDVQSAGKPSNIKYFNKRAEIWYEMANWVKGGGQLPFGDGELLRELTAPTYSFQGGKIRLEEKQQIKDRLGHSTDRADSIALTFCIPDMPSGELNDPFAVAQPVQSDIDYSPFAKRRR